MVDIQPYYLQIDCSVTVEIAQITIGPLQTKEKGAMPKATLTAGVFGCACWNDNDLLKIMVNVRTDQVPSKKAGWSSQ